MIITLKREDVLPAQLPEHCTPLSYLMDPNTDSLCNVDNVVYLRHKFGEKEQMIYLGYSGRVSDTLSLIESTRLCIAARDDTELELIYDKDDPQEDFIRFVELIERRAKG